MEIKFYLKMLQRRWWIVGLTVILAVNVALITAYLTKPVYHSSAVFTVSPSTELGTTGQETLNSLDTLDKPSINQTYAEVLNSQRVYEETLKSMNLRVENMTSYTRSAVVLPSANVLELTVEGSDPKLVALLANNLGQNAIAHIKQIYTAYNIIVLDPALVPSIPISPQPVRDAGVACLLGLVIGAALAIASEQIRVPLDSYRLRASLDPISLVFTRRYINHRIDELLSQNQIDETSLGLIRLNGLRDLIDTLPQSIIQQLMRYVATSLSKELRGNDVICRWSKTTFALLLPSTNEIAAARTMERIRNALHKPVDLENYGETVNLDPYISVTSFQVGDTTVGISKRAEDGLERIQLPGNNVFANEEKH